MGGGERGSSSAPAPLAGCPSCSGGPCSASARLPMLPLPSVSMEARSATRTSMLMLRLSAGVDPSLGVLEPLLLLLLKLSQSGIPSPCPCAWWRLPVHGPLSRLVAALIQPARGGCSQVMQTLCRTGMGGPLSAGQLPGQTAQAPHRHGRLVGVEGFWDVAMGDSSEMMSRALLRATCWSPSKSSSDKRLVAACMPAESADGRQQAAASPLSHSPACSCIVMLAERALCGGWLPDGWRALGPADG